MTSNNGSGSGVANGIGGSDEGSGGRGGFDRERLQWWIEFLIEAGSKVVSKDTWSLVSSFVLSLSLSFFFFFLLLLLTFSNARGREKQFLEFTRTIDRDFETYDEEGKGSRCPFFSLSSWNCID